MNDDNKIPKVLIVDDTYYQRIKLRNYFESRGYEIVGEADNGREGVNMFERFKPDLVTMDVNMPYMDGIEALSKIMNINSDARVIMISAMGDPGTKKQARDAGALDFVTKPFSMFDLDKKFESALQQSFPEFFERQSLD